MVDIDHFKTVNDTWGHGAGDLVIQQLTQRMGRVLRPYDSIGRFGGEEFLVLTPNCRLSEAMEVAERLRLSIAADPMVAGQYAIPVTASIGVSTIAEAVTDVNLALRAADCALYEAKRKGRNRAECRVFPEPASPPPAGQGDDEVHLQGKNADSPSRAAPFDGASGSIESPRARAEHPDPNIRIRTSGSEHPGRGQGDSQG